MSAPELIGQLVGKFEFQKRLLLTAGAAPSHQYSAEAGESSTSSSSSRQRTTTLSETVKAKLISLGMNKILRVGGMKKIFRRVFSVNEGERLLKASQCCLSTTAGPISGFLFISTQKIAFCSDRPILEFPSPTTAGEKLRCRYKVSIPLRMIKRAIQSENMKRPSERYLQVVTTDEFAFWFIGFINYKRILKCLHQAISEV